MDYLLERKVKINREPKYSGLYKWSLNEYDDKEQLVGGNWIPFDWRFWFTGTSLHLATNFNIERDFKTEVCKSTQSKTIYGKFYSGICIDGKNLTDEVSFSIFGSTRTIKEFTVFISEAKEGSEDVCWFSAFASYETEGADLRKVIEPESAGFDIQLNSIKFNELVKLIETRSIDSVNFSAKNIDGVYAYWTPTIITHQAKFLTSNSVIEGLKDTEFDGTTVGRVGYFDINFITQASLNKSQRLSSLDFPKQFEDTSDDYVEDNKSIDLDNDAERNENLVASLIKVVNSLRTVLWCVFAVLLFLLLK